MQLSKFAALGVVSLLALGAVGVFADDLPTSIPPLPA